MRYFIIALCSILMLLQSSCTTPVAMQHIPISTTPHGAQVYVNGKYKGDTPLAVDLERNQDHLITLIKENYQLKDISIKREFQQNDVYLKSSLTGINSALFFKDPMMGANSAINSIEEKKQTGEAYVLIPGVITVPLEKIKDDKP